MASIGYQARRLALEAGSGLLNSAAFVKGTVEVVWRSGFDYCEYGDTSEDPEILSIWI